MTSRAVKRFELSPLQLLGVSLALAVASFVAANVQGGLDAPSRPVTTRESDRRVVPAALPARPTPTLLDATAVSEAPLVAAELVASGAEVVASGADEVVCGGACR